MNHHSNHPGYDGEDVAGLVRDIMEAEPVPLDRWSLSLSPVDPEVVLLT